MASTAVIAPGATQPNPDDTQLEVSEPTIRLTRLSVTQLTNQIQALTSQINALQLQRTYYQDCKTAIKAALKSLQDQIAAGVPNPTVDITLPTPPTP